MNFENYKTCHGIMISCMDTMVKIWESFAQVFSTDVRNQNISIEVPYICN